MATHERDQQPQLKRRIAENRTLKDQIGSSIEAQLIRQKVPDWTTSANKVYKRSFEHTKQSFQDAMHTWVSVIGGELGCQTPSEFTEEEQAEALWDQAVESLGRSAGVMEELAESTGEAIARIAARGDRIDRIQKETRTLLNALVAPGADA